MSPIKHIWDVLDRRIRQRVPVPANIQQLCTAIEEEWTNIPLPTINNLINSMRRRCVALQSKLTPHLKLVMLRMKGVKTSISNLLLSENTSQVQTDHSLMCVKQGEVCGNLITLVEIPALFNNQLSEQEVMRLTLHCVSICDPGVHAFLIAVPGDALTDEKQSELEMFQSIFGSRVHDHTIFLINQQSQRQQLHESLHSVIKACGGRYGFYSSRTDADELITRVKDLLKENCSHLYTMAMYTYEQIQTQLQYKSEKEYLQQQMTELKISNQTKVYFSGTTYLSECSTLNRLVTRCN
ncbi:uncharacterized protein LOC128515578 [Clarias gariepinus]|uniref:uncharacterized protein LOC128515578 n=1 Tax=Clarias gariepinus TaxID=13013 RepID=UPI00234D9F00|nr:uncharacterized protein LOC128515578 [Clarias gariepinus]